MTEFKGTKGQSNVFMLDLANWKPVSVLVGKAVIRCESPYISIEEQKANAELICEAFNVANETGQTPIQLKERLEKAVELLSLFVSDPHHKRLKVEINTFLSEETKK